MSGLTYEEALSRLELVRSEFDLRDLILQIDSSSGDLGGGLLFSGSHYDGTWYGDVVDAVEESDPNVRSVRSSAVGRFLDFGENLHLRSKLVDLVGGNPSIPGSPSYNFLNGIEDRATGTKIDGIWDAVSRKFAAQLSGAVHVLVSPSKELGVFRLTELDVLLNNEKVTSIEGIDRSFLLQMSKTEGGLDRVKDAIAATSFARIEMSGLIDPLTGNVRNAAAYLDTRIEDLLAFIRSPANLAALHSKVANLRTVLDVPGSTAWVYDAAGTGLRDLRAFSALTEVGTLAVTRHIAPHLHEVGAVGVALSAVFAASEAEAASSPEEARWIMERWAFEAVGSEVGSIAARAIAAAAVAAVGATAIVSVPLIIGASIAGGLLGALGAESLHIFLNRQDEADRREMLQRLHELYFGKHAIASIDRLPAAEAGFHLVQDMFFLGKPGELPPDAFALASRVNLSFRYALVKLNPFIIVQPDSFYDAKHNGEGQLDRYDPDTGLGLTDAYLDARAKALHTKSKLMARGEKLTGGKIYPGGYDYHYLDADEIAGDDSAGVHLDLHYLSDSFQQLLFGGDGDDTLQASAGKDMLFGGDGADRLIGGGDSDHLEGGRGDDILDGGSGADTLLGGQGYDTYLVSAGDVIDDYDGAGRVLFDGDVIIGGVLDDGSGRYLSDGGHYQYWMDGDDLIVRRVRDDARLAVTAFVSGDLGIRLEGSSVSPAAYNVVIDVDGDDLLFGTIDESRLDHDPDLLNHFNLPDHIQGLGGRDWIYAWNDVVQPTPDTDLVEGGDGRDFIHGGAGDDKLYATDLTDASEVMAGQGALTYGGAMGQAGDFVSGQSGNDLLVGSGRLDGLFGGDGDDLIFGGGGNDEIYGDWQVAVSIDSRDRTTGDFDWFIAVDDRVVSTDVGFYRAGSGNDTVFAGDGNDTVYGGAADDVLYGEQGDDRLSGDLAGTRSDGSAMLPGEYHGNDYLSGGAGNDTLNGNGGDDVLLGGTGNDWLEGDVRLIVGDDAVYHGDDYLDGGDGADKLSGQGGADILLGGDGDDLLFGDLEGLDVALHGADQLHGGAGNDQMVGHGGDDRLFGGSGIDIIYGDDVDAFIVAGDDLLVGGDGDDELHGGLGNDLLHGDQGDDSVWGDAGDDTLMGGEGVDFLNGGIGADIYALSSGDSRVIAAYAPVETIVDKFGEGNLLAFDTTVARDSVRFEINGQRGDVIVRFGDADKVLLNGGLTINSISFAGGRKESLADFIEASQPGLYYLTGADSNDSVFGSSGDDTLDGGRGSDRLYGGAGDDLLISSDGSKRLYGGPGADTYRIAIGGDHDRDGRRVQEIYDDADGSSVIEFGPGIQATDFAGFQTLPFSSDVLVSTAGLSVIINDGVSGEVVNTFRFENGPDLSYSEFKSLVTTPRTTLNGNAYGETINGTSASEELNGLGGNDLLYGGGGRDRLDGGSGADRMAGGAGFDFYVVDNLEDEVIENFDEGWDSVSTTVDFSLPDNVERLMLTGDDPIDGNGNNLANFISGNAASNTVYGGDGDDVINGNGGGDVLHGDAGDDRLYGGYNSAVTIYGGTGDDYLEAYVPNNGSIAVHLDGGDGDDVYRLVDPRFVDSNAEIVEAPDEGVDTLILEGEFIDLDEAPANIENIDYRYRNSSFYYLYASGVQIGGNELDNQLRIVESDPDAVHKLYGYGGNDTLIGSTWNDGSYSNSDYLGGGDGHDILDGRDGDDKLSGHAGNDHLDGGRGDDTLNGGEGFDTLLGGAGDDTYVFTRGDGADVVSDYQGTNVIEFVYDIVLNDLERVDSVRDGWVIEYTDGDQISLSSGTQIEQLVFYADGRTFSLEEADVLDRQSFNFIGGTLGDDLIHGTMGADLIEPGDGADEAYGGGGNDRLVGGGGSDHLHGEAGDDELLGGDNNDHLFGGDGDDRLVGGEGRNHLYGEAGDDELIGDSDNDFLFGGDGNDILDGGQGRNELDGGAGDDVLTTHSASSLNMFRGGLGDDLLTGSRKYDSYYYRYGDGRDVIYEWNSYNPANFDYRDRIYLEDLNADDVLVTREDQSLVINMDDGGQIKVADWYKSDLNRIEFLHFADETFWHVDALHSAGLTVYALPEGEAITGLSIADRLIGGAGDDVLNGESGADYLEGGGGDDQLSTDGDYRADQVAQLRGGTGNDRLDGSRYADSYFYQAGDGRDVIDEQSGRAGYTDSIFLEAMDETGIAVTREDADLLINVLADGGQIRVERWYEDSSNRIEQLSFADGTVWDVEQLHQAGLTVHGTDSAETIVGFDNEHNRLIGNGGDDTLYGKSGDDVLSGGSGNDRLEGGNGDDVYLFSIGDGQDVISDLGGADSVRFAAGVVPESLVVTRDSDDIVVRYGVGDRVRIAGWFADINWQIEAIAFDDGRTLSTAELEALIAVPANEVVGTSGNDTLHGTGGRDAITGLQGNDILRGYAGNDDFLYASGDGNDQFFGGDGYDRVVAGDADDVIGIYGRFDRRNSIEEIDGGAGVNRILGTWHSSRLDFSRTLLINIDSIGGGSGNDSIVGTANDDIIIGGRGNDHLRGGGGDDEFRVALGDGADIFDGGDGFDRVLGTAGDDEIRLFGDFSATNSIEEIDGGGGANRILGTWHGSMLDFSHTRLVGITAIDGGHGHDTIIATDGDDVIIGSEGNDTLYGGAGNDVFEVATGHGADTVFGGAGYDRIVSESTASEIRLYGDFGLANSIEEIDGGSGGARILGTWHGSTLDFSAVTLRNIVAIDGGSGFDTIIGTAGDDVILGGRGNDKLHGGDGDDRYEVSAGDGQDLLADASGNDTLAFASANHDQLWFERSGDDLLVSTIGTSDRVRIDGWYRSAAAQLESFEALDGQALANTAVDQLVTAMAAFSRPAIGEMELGQARREALMPVIATSWQAA